MDSSGPNSYGEAEGRRTSCTNGLETTTLPMRTMTSLQSRSSIVWPPDAKVLSTSEQGSHLPGRSEGVVPLHWGTTRAELEHAFQKPMQQYNVDELTVEWDGLFKGDGSVDLHKPADVYRELRKDLRSLAGVMKQSFRFVVDDRRWPSGGTGPSSGGVLHLEPCLSELRSVAQEIVNATRSASELRIELERLRQANHLLQAQVHEAHVSLMTTEVERNDALSRLAAAELAIAAEAKRAAACEAVRKQNNVLQAQLQEAGGEIKELEEMVRELEERLATSKAEADGLAAQLRAKEGQVISHNLHGRKLSIPSEAGAPEQVDAFLEETHRVAVVSAAHCSKQQRCANASDHHAAGQRSAVGAAPGGDLTESGDAHWMGLANALVKGSRVEVRLREMPPELRRDVQQLLAQFIRKLKEDKDDSKGDDVLNPPTHPPGKHGDVDASVKAAPTAMQGGGHQVAPGIAGAISGTFAASACTVSAGGSEMLHAHVGADVATHHGGDLVDPHLRLPISNTQARGELHLQQQQQQQQQQQPPLLSVHLSLQQDAINELEAAKETIARLTAKLAETQQAHCELQQRLYLADTERAAAEASRSETQATLEEALRQATLAAETAEAEAAAQAALAAEAQVRIGEMQKALQHAVEARNALEVELQDLPVSRQHITFLESQLASCAAVIKELEGRRNDTEQQEVRERQARDAAAKELEAARQRIVRLQADLRESRSDAKIARSEAIAASRDAKAANSGLVKAQREMEEAVQRLRQVESERAALAAALAVAEGGRGQEAQATAREEAAVAEPHAKARGDSEASGNEQHKASGCEGGPPHLTTGPVVEAIDVKLLALELGVAQRELEVAKTRLAEEQSISKQEAARLEAKIQALEADLLATRIEMGAAESAYRERLAAMEAQLAKTEAEAGHKAHIANTSLLEESLAKAQQRVAELEALQRALEQDTAAAVAPASAEAWERLQQLESQLHAAEAALQQAEQRYREEGDSLRMQLAEAKQATAAAMAAAEAAAKQSQGTSVSPVRATDDAKAAVEGQQPEDDDEVDTVVLRARCRALRAELTRVQSALASVMDTWQAAAQDRLGEKLVEVQAAAAAGRVKSDDEFWAHNNEVHSLYALVNALRTSSMYMGAPGTIAAYGDNRADGAGSFGAANCSLLGTSYRRLRYHQYKETLAQMEQLLAGAAEGLLRRPAPPPPPQQQQPGLGGRTDRVQASGRGRESSDGNPSQGRSKGHGQSRNGSGVAADAAGHRANGCHQPGPSLPTGRGVVAGANATSPRRLGRHNAHTGNNLSGGGAAQHVVCAGAADLGSMPTIESSKGTGVGYGMGPSNCTLGRQSAPPLASSSFTSDTGSTRLEDDLANISLLYEIPPMGSPPKYDFSSWTWE